MKVFALSAPCSIRRPSVTALLPDRQHATAADMSTAEGVRTGTQGGNLLHRR